MEQLVSFLTSNIQFVIVIVGILYFLFFRKSPIEKRPPNRMPDFGGEARRQPERPSRPRSLSTAGRPEPPVERPPIASRAPEAFYSEAMADGKAEGEPTNEVLRQAMSNRVDVSKESRRSDGVVGNRDLARAVLWSEILGPPKARKPYRR